MYVILKGLGGLLCSKGQDQPCQKPACMMPSVVTHLLMFLQNIAIGVAAVLGGLVLYKVIKNDDSVSFLHACPASEMRTPMYRQMECGAVILYAS